MLGNKPAVSAITATGNQLIIQSMVATASCVVGGIILMMLPPVEPFSNEGLVRICLMLGLFVLPTLFATWLYAGRVERRLKRSAPHK